MTPSTPDPTDAAAFAARVRDRAPVVGYWVTLDSPVSTERVSRLGYDYVCLDAQHGFLDLGGLTRGLMAVQAGGSAVGLVRVGANDPFFIGQALDAGAAGVIVPLIDTAEQAAAAVRAAKYPPHGRRSYGPMRSGQRIGPTPTVADASTLVLAMIETTAGLANVEQICATPGLDGLYLGPSDLRIAIGGAYPGDPAVETEFDDAVHVIRGAAEAAGLCAGIHTMSGADAALRLEQGFTFVSVASDLGHLSDAAAAHLETARTLPT